MADIDINELQNITALADADELLAIVSGLGKNVTWAKVKELLTAQLPVVSNNNNGLMQSTVFNNLCFYKGMVDSDTVNKIYTPGIYVHGSPIISGVNYGLLIVLNTDFYGIQIDIDFLGNIKYRLGSGNNWNSSWITLRSS